MDIDYALKNVWLICIVATVINAFLFRYRVEHYIAEDPERERGYNDMLKVMLVFLNMPWVIIGIGNSNGMTSSIVEYTYLHPSPPIVQIFYAYILITLLIIGRWVIYGSGAEFLERHPGLLDKSKKPGAGKKEMTAGQYRNTFKLLVGFGIFMVILVWFKHKPRWYH